MALYHSLIKDLLFIINSWWEAPVPKATQKFPLPDHWQMFNNKPCLKQPLKIKTKNWLSIPIIALCRVSKVLQNARRCLTSIKLPILIKTFFVYFWVAVLDRFYCIQNSGVLQCLLFPDVVTLMLSMARASNTSKSDLFTWTTLFNVPMLLVVVGWNKNRNNFILQIKQVSLFDPHISNQITHYFFIFHWKFEQLLHQV